MSSVPDISDLLKDGKINFTNEELNKIIDTELAKPESDQNKELINLCRTLSDPKDPPAQESKTGRSFSFRLVSLIVTIAVLIFAMVPIFSKYINTNQSVTNPPTEMTINKNTSSGKLPTTTETTTDVVSDPTKPVTESDTGSSSIFLNVPEQILFYHNGKPQTIPNGDVMCDEVIKEINKVIKNDRWGILKLAVEDGYIDKLKSENLCIEIYYDETQALNGLKGHTQNKYSFEKILIILDGIDKNTLFFCKDGEYQHGPIKAYSSDLSAEVLKDIFDEWVTQP